MPRFLSEFRQRVEIHKIGKPRLEKVRTIIASDDNTKNKINKIRRLKLSKYSEDRIISRLKDNEAIRVGESFLQRGMR